MEARRRRAVWLLGLCQCLLWGALYYGFSVLLVPLEQALALPRVAVAGAYSVALLAMALAAPAVGRLLDADRAGPLFRAGLACALAGLALVAWSAHWFALYLGWLLVGLSMAALLYEPAFALVIRAFADAHERLRALAAVTVLGGLASTVALPLLATVVQGWGWRVAVAACAAVVVLAVVAMERVVLPALPARSAARALGGPPRRMPWPAHLRVVALLFSGSTVAVMAVTTLLIPMLVARGMPATSAALALGAFGAAQLPGRLWLLRQRGALASTSLHVLPLLLLASGLLLLVLAQRPLVAAAGVMVFGAGAGLQTLVRPWLLDRLYGSAEAGRWNGEVARVQGLARAAAPVAAAAAASLVGTGWVLAALAVGLVGAAALASRLPLPENASPHPQLGVA